MTVDSPTVPETAPEPDDLYNPEMRAVAPTATPLFTFTSKVHKHDAVAVGRERELDVDDRLAMWLVQITMAQPRNFNFMLTDVELCLAFDFTQQRIELAPGATVVPTAGWTMSASVAQPLKTALGVLEPGNRADAKFSLRTGYFTTGNGASTPPGRYPVSAWLTYNIEPLEKGFTDAAPLRLEVRED